MDLVLVKFRRFHRCLNRNCIDEFTLSEVSSSTRWIKAVPIKVNVLAWKIKLDNLPTRLNISRRGMDIDSILCPTCGKAVESTRHIFSLALSARDICHLIHQMVEYFVFEYRLCKFANKEIEVAKLPKNRILASRSAEAKPDEDISSHEHVKEEIEQCDHSLTLEEDIDYVCRVCRIIQRSIESR
ncbi:RNA-directed DNA polymerase, eukaryota [Tanacetum coccineum]